MKKLILILSILTAAYSAHAEEGIYLKGATGLNQVNPFKIRDDEYQGKIKIAHVFPMVEAGVGYQFGQGVRVEGVFDYYFLFHSEEQGKTIDKDIVKNFSKTIAHAFMLNGYKDITSFRGVTPFIGAGIGVSNLQEKNSGFVILHEDQSHYDFTTKTKLVRRLAYKLTLGVDYKIRNDIDAEISYNYFNLGYNKPQMTGEVNNTQQRRYSIHNIMLGIRYRL